MKPKYITPRIAIVTVTNSQDIPKITQFVQSRHKHYHHYFNLTKLNITPDKQSHFKWRGLPFSITQTLKMLLQIDAFLRNNLANSAILCVGNPSMQEFAHFVVKCYLEMCCISAQNQPGSIKTLKIVQLAASLLNTHPYLSKQILQIYRNISIQSPPLKILESLVLEPEDLFIPIVTIMTESRYNDFEEVYAHPIEEELGSYYLNLNKPLEIGIGTKYYDHRPQTKYFKKPVLVCGDVKIALFSYKTLKKQHEFTVGFNTHNIDHLNSQHEGLIILQDRDLYQKSTDLKPPITVKIEYSDYCDNAKCKNVAYCSQCRQATKRLGARYGQAQSQLNKLSRKRGGDEICIILGV